MQKISIVFRKYILVIGVVLTTLYPAKAFSSTNNSGMLSFLPMEDAFSTARNTPDYIQPTTKMFREPIAFTQNNSKTNIWDKIDIFAFVLLGIVFFLITNRNSKPRNISL